MKWRGGSLFVVASVTAVACQSFGTENEDVRSAPEVPDAARTACAAGSAELGRIGTYEGKVNVHTPQGTGDDASKALNGWYPDVDCVSGADEYSVDYCRKFFPSTTAVSPLLPADSTLKPYYSAGCAKRYPETGRNIYVCCK